MNEDIQILNAIRTLLDKRQQEVRDPNIEIGYRNGNHFIVKYLGKLYRITCEDNK